MKTIIPIKPVSSVPAGSCGSGSPAGFGDGGDGWRALSTLSEPRLSEMAENYKALGYEVEVRDIQRTEGGCNTCFDAGEAIGQVFGTLYVRKAEEPGNNELFD